MSVSHHDLPDDLHPLETALLTAITDLDHATTDVADIDPLLVATWLEAQITSRVLDHTARTLRAGRGLGYYTIGSAGHESNAVVASALRIDDPALLHYRSGGFFVARSLMARGAHVGGDAVRDILRGMLARSTEPIAGGRHKVFGSRSLSIIPQTSTIASHLPRAVGLALSGGVAPDADTTWPDDMVVVCSFGDGSLNHSTTQGALNWAGHSHYRGERVPILFLCEDNGLGLSVPTPTDWVRTSLAGRHGLRVEHADGADPIATWNATTELVDDIRRTGRPGVLHLSTVRYLGHAGTDVESAYRSPDQLSADLARDPIIGAARAAAACGVSSPEDTIAWYLDTRDAVGECVEVVLTEPELTTADEVMAPLADVLSARTQPLPPPRPGPVGEEADDRLTMAQAVNAGLAELLDTTHDVALFGEDVGRKGGAYGVTRGLQKRFGDRRVFDMLLDEQSILGMALGSALNGRFPIPEIQYLAYLHNAEDQLRGEAASLGFFSQGQYRNPMVVRVAGYGYQKGFGGHFHNDNSIAVLRDIPGLAIASPAHPADAAPMLRECVDHARATGAVCVYLEPIARYHDPDLHEPGDGEWTAPSIDGLAPLGRARTHRPPGDAPSDITIVTWANGTYLSRRAQRRLEADHGVRATVVDLRWIAPLPVADMVAAATETGRVLVVDETRRTGGVGEGLVAELVDGGFDGHIDRIAARDSFVPLGAAANLVLVSEDDIVARACQLASAG
ncbi:thiamine pyrophosphate-dependent enzyme [Ilumatobacter nonamiensis]|uniref:thiamine pyrophosphate-dependent enzyme n=1 Tax=Ilumatobacter nonamiensis TaxID=467093 RepID=UPI00034ABA07|nr:thiamine pyrophosphate-dependent enzyme [Ilumatobacter nonamiensis]